MTITLNVQELLIGLLILAGVGVLVSLMVLIIKAIPGVVMLQEILKNTSEITAEAAQSISDAKAAMASVKASVSNICGTVDKHQGKLKSALELAKAVANIGSAVKSEEGSKKK